MTDEQKKEWFKSILNFVLTVLASLILFSLTVDRENKTTVKNKLQELETKKSDITYVDEKCKEIKLQNNQQFDELKSDIREIRETQNKMYEILINKK